MIQQTTSYAREWTLEIVPAHAERADVFTGLVKEIFVTMIPGTDPRDTVSSFAPLQAAGFDPVPHVAARAFASDKDLAYLCDALREHGIRKTLVLAGGQGKEAGPFDNSLKLLQSEAFQRSGVEVVALAGHPEGNPVDADAAGSLVKKWKYLQEAGLSCEVVTQWSFSPDKVSEYIQSLRDEGISAPVRVGVAGPASLKTLLKYAQICGVTAAKDVLKKQGFSFGRLLMSNDPRRFVERVQGTECFHLYPFGGLEKCAKWLQDEAAVVA
ncbi:MAG: methylenetetrahydrofolate reductase [Opitutales bacterium]|nr:methylenetetrahydrofolate reductase [Opitutales bacterium]